MNTNQHASDRAAKAAFFRPGFLAGLVFTATAALSAQPFWEKKPYQEWSKSECQKVLRDSPWTAPYAFTRAVMSTLQSGSGRGDDRDREANPEIRYLVQVRSALPVRQALVRQVQLSPEYQKLTPEQRQATDRDAAKLLAEQFADMILIHVEYTTNVQGYITTLARQWQTRTVSDLQNSTFLIGPRGQRISPSRFQPSPDGPSFSLFFPRLVNGEPLVNKNDKELKLEFPHPAVGVLPDGRVLVEFRVPKMMFGGNLSY